MRNAKLWSVLLAAMLVCACAVGVLFTGASASDTRIPTATTTYVVGVDGDTIRACLDKAAAETWAAGTVLEIQFSGTDSSIYASPDAANGISGYTMFETATIFREDHTKLPIVIRGMDEDKAATIKTPSNSYNATNDYYFTNLTVAGGKQGSTVTIFAGSGELVFENTKHNSYDFTWYFGDCQVTDAWEGWDAAKVEANKNEKGLLETGITFGTGTKFYANFSKNAPDELMRLSAVGYNGDATTNPVLDALTRTPADVKEALTEDEVQAVKDAAPSVPYRAGNVVTDCIVKPWDTAAYLVLDSGTANPTSAEFGYCGARKGISPVREATLEAISGGYQYLSADSHNSKKHETYVGDTKVIMRGGKTLSNAVGIRLTNEATLVGNLTLEIHEDDANFPTQTKFVQATQNGVKDTIFGNYHFLMTGGTIGDGYSTAKVDSSTGNQAVNAENEKQWNYNDGNDGYWGAPRATGTIVNEVRGGHIWAFYGARYSIDLENTPVSIVLPGTGETLTAMVSVHNKISGGTIGGIEVQGTGTDSEGNLIDVQNGTKAFYAGTKTGSSSSTTYKVTSVCNEISGGTIYDFRANNVSTSRKYQSDSIYNFVYGTETDYPTFLCDFYGTKASGGYNITNVIKGYPKFNDGTYERFIYGGCRTGTITRVTNYFGGLPEFKNIYGGCSGSSTASGTAAVQYLTTNFAFDDTEDAISGELWGGNGYYQYKGIDGATETKGQSGNYITYELVTNVYSGTYGTIRAESAAGTDASNAKAKEIVFNVYGGTWKNTFIPVNRGYKRSDTTMAEKTMITNIYGGTFNNTIYMGGQNNRNQNFVNNIYGGTFKATYYGGGSVWAKTIENNIYGGTFTYPYYGGGNACGSESIVNNIYGGTFSDEGDYMGSNGLAEKTANRNAGTIENNFYGAKMGEGWTYGGHKNGPADTITNHFHDGADNPCRDPENELYKYYDADTMLAGGTHLRDQFMSGSGYSESLVDVNTANSITNTLEGGLWTKATGAGANITFHGGMRWGTVGNVTNNFIKGTYFRTFGGSDYGRVTGTVTNNFGKALSEGEEAPALVFTAYTFGSGLEAVNIGSKIAAAKEVAEADRTATQKAWVNMEATYGEGLEAGAEFVVNNIYYGTFHQFFGGSRQDVKSGYQGKYDTITNNVYGGTFDKLDSESTVFAGGVLRNGIIKTGIVNNINGGTFNGNYYGGSVGLTSVVVSCPSITNVFNGGEGMKGSNTSIYMGNGSQDFNGVITTTINDFTANNAYVYAGCYGIHNAPEGADYAIDTTVNGGTFIGFWGQGGGYDSVLTGNVRTTVNGGTFDGYSVADHMRNSIAGGSRNGKTIGNIELIINDGTFTADVVGGIIWGSQTNSLKEIDGNVTTTIKGGDFREDIHAVCRVADAIDLSGTATVTVEQTAGVALKLGGEAEIDSFTANGETVALDAEANVKIKALTGAIAFEQTEGWLAHDYVVLPAGSLYTVATAQGAYGSYTADETILISGNAVASAGATIRLAERLGVRIVLTPDDVDAYGEAFTYAVAMGDVTLAKGGYDELKANGYSILFDGIGLAQFDEKFTVTSPVMKNIEYSIVDLAVMAQTAWVENAKWKAYADAIVEFDNVYNKNQENTLTPDAVTLVPSAQLGAAGGVANASAALLMADAAGLRLEVTLDAAPANAKILVNDEEVDARMVTVAENTVTADLYFAHEYLADEFTVSVVTDAGVHMTYTASIEAMAYELATNDANENKDNAQAFLVYVQKAVACK